MAERKASNKYIPPDFDPKKHKTINKYQHSNPLRQRASKLQVDGSLVIRFELPFDGVCSHCSKGIAKGTRFNARKYKDGEYLSPSIPIFKFTMKCYECNGQIVIRTDPEHSTYRCMEGLAWRTQGLTISSDDGSNNVNHGDEQTLLDTRSEMIVIGQDYDQLDAMERIQHEKTDLAKSENALPILESIIELNKSRMGNDFEMNSKLRASHRKLRSNEKESCNTLEKRLGANFVDRISLRSLLPEEILEDGIIAKQELSSRIKKQTIQGTSTSSIFNQSSSSLHKRNLEKLKPDNIVELAKEFKKRKKMNEREINSLEIDQESGTCETRKWTPQKSKPFSKDKSNNNGVLKSLEMYGRNDEDQL